VSLYKWTASELSCIILLNHTRRPSAFNLLYARDSIQAVLATLPSKTKQLAVFFLLWGQTSRIASMDESSEIRAEIPLVGRGSVLLGKLPPPVRGQRRSFPEPLREEGFYSRTFLPSGYVRDSSAPAAPETVAMSDSSTYRYTDPMLQDLPNYEPSGRIASTPSITRKVPYLTGSQMDKIAPAELLTSPVSPKNIFTPSPSETGGEFRTPRSARSLFGHAKAIIAQKIMTRQAINTTPCTPRAMSSAEEAGTCSVCLESFTLGSTIRTLSCEHVFHQECIDKWCERTARCPVDNLPILAKWRGNY
jgi:Ring finger domain